MIKMMEVVGISNTSFSDATKSVVNKLLQAGHKVYWFEVVEQRGAVKGEGIEFQVKVNVAVEHK
jgi:flavin-binding protein dodecin